MLGIDIAGLTWLPAVSVPSRVATAPQPPAPPSMMRYAKCLPSWLRPNMVGIGTAPCQFAIAFCQLFSLQPRSLDRQICAALRIDHMVPVPPLLTGTGSWALQMLPWGAVILTGFSKPAFHGMSNASHGASTPNTPAHAPPMQQFTKPSACEL